MIVSPWLRVGFFLLHFAGYLFWPMVVCAIFPAILFCFNLRRYRRPRSMEPQPQPPAVAVLIPARNEAANIAACVESVLASRDIELTVTVLDDASTDATALIVAELAARDPRVRLANATALPAGWNGKQHACWLLAQSVTAPLLLFLDADVRLAPTAIARAVHEQQQRSVALLSGFPRLITITWLEQLLLPLIHFILLSYLPLRWMQRGTSPAFAAGCGQFMLVERAAYFTAGGHAAIRDTRHDGLRLPQAFRQHGLRTDLVDLTHEASVRMYATTAEVWNGLAKNATEGLAAPARIVPFTLLLLLGQVLPTALLLLSAMAFAAVWQHHTFIVGVTHRAIVQLALWCAAIAASLLPRLIAAHRFRQPVLSALLHPIGVAVLLVLEWYALLRQLAGKPVAWRDRSYSTTAAPR